MSDTAATNQERPTTVERPERAVLPRDLGEFLIELSISVHRNAMYPPGHPSLAPVAENVISRLAQCFLTREEISIGVARDQLVIQGVATDSKHPVLSDLARRLHEHEIGALTLEKGVVAREIRNLLEALASDVEEKPVGRLEGEEALDSEHVRIRGADFERLRIDGESDPDVRDDRAARLWIGLAQEAIASEGALDEEDPPGPRALAERIGAAEKGLAYEKVIVGYLLQLAEELRGSSGGEAESIRARVSSLVRELDEETLERMVRLGGDRSRIRQFVLDANQSLAVEAVMKIVKAAAQASEQTISHALTRMLTKLSMHAEGGDPEIREHADSALRDHVERLIDSWELEDPHPGIYAHLLDRVAGEIPSARAPAVDPTKAGEPDDEGRCEGARRIVQMAVEVDTHGTTVQEAVSELIGRGEIPFLLDVAADAPHEGTVARKIRDELTDPRQLRRFLSGENVGEEGLRSVLDHVGSAAVEPLLDALVESESRAVRRKVFDALASFEEGVAAQVIERLDDERWYVVRNLLALIQRLDEVPDGFDPFRHLSHPDRRVRREAFPLALSHGDKRERVLAAGLSDDDDRLTRIALVELRHDAPETLVPTLVKRVIRSDRAEDVRVRAVLALEGVTSPLALDALIGLVDGGRTLLGRRKVAEPTPLVVAALRVLASTWSDDEKARSFLEAARHSKSAEIQAAARFRTEEADEQ